SVSRRVRTESASEPERSCASPRSVRTSARLRPATPDTAPETGIATPATCPIVDVRHGRHAGDWMLFVPVRRRWAEFIAAANTRLSLGAPEHPLPRMDRESTQDGLAEIGVEVRHASGRREAANPDSLHTLGVAEVIDGHAERAIDALERATATRPQDA